MTDPLEQAFLRLRHAADADEYVPTERVIDEVLRRLKEHERSAAYMRKEIDRLYRALAYARDTVHDVAYLGDADYLYDHLDNVLKMHKP